MKPKNGLATAWRLLRFLKPYRYALLAIVGTALLGTVFQILAPKWIGLIVTELFDGVLEGVHEGNFSDIDISYIARIIIGITTLYLISAIFGYVQQVLAGNVSQRTIFDLRKGINEKLAKLPLRYFDSRSKGDVLSRAVNDVDNVGNTLQQVVSQLISSAFTMVGVVVMMLTISPLLTIVVVVTLPLSYIGIKAIASRSLPHFKNVQYNLGKLNGHVEETYTGHAIVKSYGTEESNMKAFQAVNERMYKAGKKAQFISGLMWPLLSVINNLGFIMICIVGGISVTRGVITVGNVQAFIQYAETFTQPLTQVANIANVIQSGIASAERIFEILDAEDERPDVDQPLTIVNPRGEVKFEGVYFRYQEDTPLIEGMNIHVKQGQKVAIVGPTGAGKTTIVNLLLRFYELEGGAITIDNVNITELHRGDLRRLFGMVLQDAWLFNGTIRQNIAYGRIDATEEEIVQAAHSANADSFIRKLPEGYDTFIDEGGAMLSQGQRQLITIARALLANPVVLILDEATSNVDTRTEAHIQMAMSRLMEGRTSFIIAHRLSTIQDADLILVMDKGRIVEQGSHEELLDCKGIYAELYSSQFLVVDLEAL